MAYRNGSAQLNSDIWKKTVSQLHNLTNIRNIHSATGKHNIEIQKTTKDTLQYSQNQ